MVSVIVPVYNSEKYLDRCVKSILSQTYQDFEVILVDDGSTDKSAIIIDDYSKTDNRIRVLHQHNQGASVARKNGLLFSAGEWVSFVDSDDTISEDYLERLYITALKCNQPIAACISRSCEAQISVPFKKKDLFILLDKRKIVAEFFRYNFWSFYGKIYQKSLFNDLYFPKYTINEDYVVMAQLFEKIEGFPFIPERLYYFSEQCFGLSHTSFFPRMFDEFHNKRWVVDFYKKNNSTYVKQAEAQLIETCVKLIRAIPDEQYEEEKRMMQLSIRNNLIGMLFNKHLKMGLKLKALQML